MGFWGNFLAKFTWVSTFLLLLFSLKMVKTQMAGCSFQGLGLEQCLNLGNNSISITTDPSCCIALNQVVEAGFHCLCLFLASHDPPLSTPFVFPLSSDCFISTPPLTQCQVLVPVLQPPVPPPQPPVTPALQPPVLLPSDTPQGPPQPLAPNAFLLPPPPPPPQELPLKSTSDKNSTTPAMQLYLNNNSATDLSAFKSGYILLSDGHKKTISFQSRLFVAATLCACMI